MKQLILLLPLILCVSCISFNEPPQTHYYLLEPTSAEVPILTADQSTINIRILEFPEVLERNQLVLLERKNMVKILNSERWADPLKGNIQAVIRDNLQQQMPNAFISGGLWEQHQNPDQQIDIRIKRFIGKPETSMAIEIDWQSFVDGKADKSGHFFDKQRPGESIQELVAAMNQSLNKFCLELSAEINR
jgi:uncharacterized lipoprotein YmbA